MPTQADLGRRIKAKHPEYSDLDDAVLGAMVQKKFPGAYDDFVPEMHKPDVQMHEQLTPGNTISNLAKGGASGFVDSINPLNMIKGLYQTGVNTLNDPTGMKRGMVDEQTYENELRHPSVASTLDNPEAVRGIGEVGGNIAGQLAMNEAGARLSNAKAPIGQRIGAEESRLDQAGIVPPGQQMSDALENVRQRNMTSQGVPYTAPLDKRLSKVGNQIQGIYTDPANPPKFSELSKLKSTLQKEASPSFFDTGKVVANKQGAGEASRAIRGELRNTPGAEDWSQLQDEAARGHRIDERVGKAAGALAGIAAPYVGLTHGEGPLGLIGAPFAAKMGAKAGEAASHWITSGEAANQLKPIGPAVRALPLTRKDDDED